MARRRVTASKILGPTGEPFVLARPPQARVRARYDSAETTEANRKHWAMADGLSADATNSPGVRRTLRNRARYEVANNSYARGITRTIANDVIGSGPRLQLDPSLPNASRYEQVWATWAKQIRLASKLRTMRIAQCQDGEAFAILVNNPALRGPVQLDLRLVEAEMVTTPFLQPWTPRRVDGLVLDDAGNVLQYHVLKRHPGDVYGMGTLEYDTLDARYVVHLYRAERPGQHRGIPELTAALPLFALLRRYTLATVRAAEVAATLGAAMMQTTLTDGGAAAETDDEPFTTLDIEPGMMTMLPEGWTASQLKPEQPTQTYGDFKTQLLCEVARCLLVPKNIVLGDSSGYNYSSGRLDHQVYFRACDMDRVDVELECTDRLMIDVLREAATAAGDRAMVRRLDNGDVPHAWRWDPVEDIDPAKTAAANRDQLSYGLTTLPAIYAEAGRDWETELAAQAQALGMPTAQLRAAIAAKLYGPAPTPVVTPPAVAPTNPEAEAAP